MPRGVPNPPLSTALIHEMTEEGSGGCRLWTGALGNNGYARYKIGGKYVIVHRWVYEAMVGEIGPWPLWTVDHLCHEPATCAEPCQHRRCLEPTHLKATLNRENSLRGGSPLANKARQTDCVRGHSLTGDNLYVTPSGRRQCRACRKAALVRWAARQ